MSSKYTKESLSKAVAQCKSWKEVVEHFGLRPASGSQGYIKYVATLHGIDFSHFPGRKWKRRTGYTRTAIEKYFSGEVYINSHNLKLRLIKDGLKKRECERCSLAEWQGQELPLHLDHKDRDFTNNSLENLQLLCPNCHSLKTRADRKK